MRTVSMFGREREAKRLAELIDGVDDQGGALLVRGEAGIGKTTLLAHGAALAGAAGMRVLTAVGAESEVHLPYAGLHQILHPIRTGIDLLPAPQRDAVQAALGITDRVVPDAYLVGLAVLNLLADVAAHAPVMVVVEDAHWLDRSSADVLGFVARRVQSEPMALLAAVRDGVASPLQEAGLALLSLERLSEDAAASLLDAVAPGLAPAVRGRLLDEAAGNPLALTELPGAAQALEGADARAPARLPLTARLERAFTARVSELPAATRTVLLVAALNDSTSVAEALEAGALAVGAKVDATVLAPAVQARLVDLGSGVVSFRHPLMRSAIPQTASLAERQAAHAALAEALRGQADRRAWHRAAAAAGPDESVAAELESTADRAQRRGGVGAAVAALERAARLSDGPARRAERLLRAADLAVESGRQDVVVRLLDQVSLLELSAQQRARVVWIRGSFDDGMRDDSVGAFELARLAEQVAADGDVDLVMRILWSAALRCFWAEPGAAARQHIVAVAEALPIGERDPRLMAILAYAAPIERGTAVIHRLAGLAGQPSGDPQVERLLGTAALLVGAFDLAVRLSAASVSGLRTQGRLGLLARALGAQAWSAGRLADLSVAIPASEEASRLARETTQPFLHAMVLASEAEIAALRGDYDRADVLASQAEQVSLPAGARPVLATVQVARGLAALGDGRYGDAYAHLRRMHDPADPAYQVALRCYAVAELAEAAVRSGRTEAIWDVMEGLEAVAATTKSPALHAGLRYARAVLADDDKAEELFEVALSADLTGWSFVRARTQLAFGEWLRRQRRAVQSRGHLRAARETFDALGAIPWSDRARQELRAAGEVSPHRSPDARDQLTAHELHIAQLAAEGLTNRQIGQRLYLSHRTVSTHLHRIFPKLGITSRSALGAALTRPDPVTAP
ncbi:AAA family ATPase [Plantactinospora solaniradicis]|uniref:AAA family ATPase n=1 Tax=Plantactinospora solaniradicis TaxID=1723736 RepID=A0ABW1KRV4_9ACTN